MGAVARLRRFAWFLVFWFFIMGVAVLAVFSEYARQFFAPMIFPSPAPEPTMQLVLTNTPPDHSARSVWLYDQQSGSLLWEKNPQMATSVASLSKLMTAYAAYESYGLEHTLQVGSAAGVLGNRAKLLPRDQFSVADLLRAMLVFSANDAAQTLAQGHAEGARGFVEYMNARAHDLGLTQTHFDNSYGIDSPGQYSTAQDMGKLTLQILQIPFFAQTVASPVVTVREQQTGRIDTIYTTNSLLYRSPAVLGVKTGTTAMAGESLIVRAKFDPNSATASAFFAGNASAAARLREQPPLDLILVLLGSQDRYTDATNLLRWAVQNAEWVETPPETEYFQQDPVADAQ